MGNILGKKKKSKVTEHDRAVLDLKTQRDKLTQAKKRINEVIAKETQLAKELVKAGKKSQAMTVLKKKKFQEQQLAKCEANLDNIQEMIDSIEFAQMQKKVFDSLKVGNEALTALNNEMSVEDIEALLDESDEALAIQREIEEAIAGSLTDADNEELEAELGDLEASMMEEKTLEMPSVPTSVPQQAEAEEEEEEEEEEEQPQKQKSKKKVAALA